MAQQLAIREVHAPPEETVEDDLGLQFSKQGGLFELCKMVTFAEMLRLRQVCSTWENVVLSHPRFLGTVQIKLGTGWGRDIGFLDSGRSIIWTAVHFDHFNPYSTQHFGRTWDKMSNNITKVVIERLTIPCGDLVNFLKRCPMVENLKLKRNHFHVEKVPNHEFTQPMGHRIRDTLRVHCVHTDWTPAPDDIQIPPRISTLILEHINYFPLCILDHLAPRCTGTLHHLTLQTARAGFKRYRHLPSTAQLDDRYFRIFRESASTLETFTISQINRGDTLLRKIVDADSRVDENGTLVHGLLQFHPREMILEQCYHWATASDQTVTHAYLDFANRFAGPHVENFGIRLLHHLRFTGLRTALLLMPNLRKLAVRINWARDIMDLAPILATMPFLVDLHVKDRRRVQNPFINSSYVNSLPMTLKSFEFSHRHMQISEYNAVCNSSLGPYLTKLLIGFGRPFDDDMMQLVIANFPNLRAFEVSDSRKLTDAGVTGLPLASCKALLENASYHLMLTHPATPTKRSILELKYLNWLSFDGCRKISDVTILIAIRFPHLRFLNLCQCLFVTDIGLANLSRYNPGLERIFLRKNRHISHFGLNELIKNLPTIQHIHTTRPCRDRKLGNVNYEEDPNYARLVTYARWDEKIIYRNA